MEEDEDDLYSGGPTPANGNGVLTNQLKMELRDEDSDGDIEMADETEEEDESESDQGLEFVTETADGEEPKPAQSAPSTSNQRTAVKKEPVQPTTTGQPTKAQGKQPVKTEQKPGVALQSGSEFTEVRTSTIDVNAETIYEPLGKPVTDIDLDADLAEHQKPWRRPGADHSEYFNYGFDEFTWATYCLKQQQMRAALQAQKTESAQFEMMLGAGMMPGMQGMPAGMVGMGTPAGPSHGQGQQQRTGTPSQPAGMQGGMPQVPGMDDAVMHQLVQQMIAQGIDPHDMNAQAVMAQYQQMQAGAGRFSGGQQGQGRGHDRRRRW